MQTVAPWSFLVVQNHSHIALLTGASSNIMVKFQNLDLDFQRIPHAPVGSTRWDFLSHPGSRAAAAHLRY